jgi:hypothetical protein
MANFFPTPKPRRFNYKPWFYNEKEAKKKERYARIEKEIRDEKEGRNIDKEESGHYIKFARKERKKSNLRVYLIILALILLVFFLLR